MRGRRIGKRREKREEEGRGRKRRAKREEKGKEGEKRLGTWGGLWRSEKEEARGGERKRWNRAGQSRDVMCKVRWRAWRRMEEGILMRTKIKRKKKGTVKRGSRRKRSGIALVEQTWRTNPELSQSSGG